MSEDGKDSASCSSSADDSVATSDSLGWTETGSCSKIVHEDVKQKKRPPSPGDSGCECRHR